MATLKRFKCWWCSTIKRTPELHHETDGHDGRTRRCCVTCYREPTSVYRLVYPRGGAQERAEVGRATHRIRLHGPTRPPEQDGHGEGGEG